MSIKWKPGTGTGRTPDGRFYQIQRSAPPGERPFWGPAWYGDGNSSPTELPTSLWPMGETLTEWRAACERHASESASVHG